MFTVALIGPDGSGKSTVARGVSEILPMRAKYVYMGVNWDASNYLLPSTRLVEMAKRAWTTRSGRRPGPTEQNSSTNNNDSARPGSLLRRVLRAGWVGLYFANVYTEEWYRNVVAWMHVRGGGIVIFDRHFFFDFYLGDIAGGDTRSFWQRFHGFLLTRVFPKPDLVIYLDAPPEMLFARKGEGTVEWLAQRKQHYLELGSTMPHFVVIDAARPVVDVVDDVANTIIGFTPTDGACSRRGRLPAGRT